MKLVIKTKRHLGDRNIHKQGIQFEAYFIEAPTDTADDVNAMHELSRIVRADCMEAGWYYAFGENPERHTVNGHHGCQAPETPFTPRERVLKARAVSAENLAKAYKKQIDQMRLVLVRNRLSVSERN